MKGILAATPSGSHVVSQISSVPIIAVYLVVVAIFILVSLKLGSSAWHHIVVALALGLFALVAIPGMATKLSSFSSPGHRIIEDIILLVFLLFALIFTFRDKRNDG
jgi:hypothetical protein